MVRSTLIALTSACLLVACSSAPQEKAEVAPKAPAAAEAPVVEEAEAPVEEESAVKEISVEALSGLIEQKATVAVFDVNGDETREKFGVIPGAKLLSGHDTFGVNELPEDKASKVVFYCSSQKCSAAPKAAEKASGAGYTDVNVLRAGIKGWTAAGAPVEKKDAAN